MMDNILARAQTQKTPLIEGRIVTFVWQGDHAPRLIGDFNAWGELGEVAEMQPAGKDLWTLTVELPEDAYIEYAFMDGNRRVTDPFNPRKVNNGVGKTNHYFYMPRVAPTPNLRVKKSIPRGQVFSEILHADPFVAGAKRRVHFYQPPVTEPCPLVVVWDGQDYLKRAHLPQIVDHLIHLGQIQPIALAMPEQGGQARMLEYGCAEMTLGFVAERILPRARERLNLLDITQNPGAYGVMGASMGGLMSLYTGLRMPGIFGKVLSQSGAFSIPGYDFVVWELVKHQNPGRLKIWMDCGTFEWLIDPNRRMAALLQEHRFPSRFEIYQGGHNYTAWRNGLAGGLEWLFGAKTNF